MDEKKMFAVDYCCIDKQGATLSVRTMVKTIDELMSEIYDAFDDAKFMLAFHFAEVPPEEVRKAGVVKV